MSVTMFYGLDFGTKNVATQLINPNRITPKTIHEESSEYYRIALLKAVVEKLKGEEWIYGLGIGTFYLGDIEASYAGHSHTLTAADSQYIKILAENGLSGLISFLFLMVAICVQFIKTIKRAVDDKILAIWGFAAVIGFLFENITVSMFNYLPLGLLFWIFVAILCHIRDKAENNNHRGSQLLRK